MLWTKEVVCNRRVCNDRFRNLNDSFSVLQFRTKQPCNPSTFLSNTTVQPYNVLEQHTLTLFLFRSTYCPWCASFLVFGSLIQYYLKNKMFSMFLNRNIMKFVITLYPTQDTIYVNVAYVFNYQNFTVSFGKTPTLHT